jgi:hypothetical protein
MPEALRHIHTHVSGNLNEATMIAIELLNSQPARVANSLTSFLYIPMFFPTISLYVDKLPEVKVAKKFVPSYSGFVEAYSNLMCELLQLNLTDNPPST